MKLAVKFAAIGTTTPPVALGAAVLFLMADGAMVGLLPAQTWGFEVKHRAIPTPSV